MRIYDNATCTGTPLAGGTAAAFNRRRDHDLGPRRLDHHPARHGHRPGGHASPCSSAISYLEDSTIPAAATISSTTPGLARKRQQPRGQGLGRRGRRVGAHLRQRHLHRHPAGLGHGRRLQHRRRDHSDGGGQLDHQPARRGQRRRRQRLAVFQRDRLRRGLQRPGFAPGRLHQPRLARRREQPRGDRLGRSGLDRAPLQGLRAAPIRRLHTASASSFASPGFTISVPDDSTTNLRATATDAAGNVSACSTALDLRRRLDRPGRSDRQRHQPRLARKRQQPRGQRLGRGRLDGAHLRQRHLHRDPACRRHRRRLQRRRDHDLGPRRLDHHPARHGHRPGRPRLAVFQRDLLSRGLDDPRRCDDQLDDPGLARKRQQPRGQGLGRRGRLDGEHLRQRHLHRHPAGLGHGRRLQHRRRDHSDGGGRLDHQPARRGQRRRRQRLAVFQRDRLRRGLKRPGFAPGRLHQPRLARRREQPRGDRLGRSGLDRAPLQGLRLHRSAGCTPPRRRALPRPASRSRCPTTRPPTCARRPPTPPATSLACSTALTYVEDSTAPVAPTVSATNPASPANDNNPEVSGSAEAASTVRIYDNATCTGTPLAGGTAAAFTGAGITISVPDDSTTTLRATATDQAGHASPCSSSISYLEDSTIPAAATISSTTPASPANDNSPEVKGSGAEAGSTVHIYDNATCTGTPLGSGSAAAFNTGAGITATVAANSTTNLRAAVKDDAGNVSPCSNAIAYVEDSNAPAAPQVDSTSPASPADENNPEVIGSAEAGSTVRLYKGSDCTAPPAAHRLGVELCLARLHDLGARRLDHQPARHGHRRRRQRLCLLDGTRLRRRLDRPGRSDRHRHQPRLARKRQQPRGQRLGRGRLDGAHLRQRHLHRDPACRRHRRRLHRRRDHRSRSPTTRPPPCARRPPTPPATSPPARRHSPTSKTRPFHRRPRRPIRHRPTRPPAPGR